MGHPLRLPIALVAATLPLAGLPALASPVICTTTLEAPPQAGRTGGAAPVEVTRCGVVETTEALVDRRAFTWRSSFARGVGLPHQITDILGIAMGGRDGNTVMGLGFPDQAIIWDGSAIQNTAAALLEEQGSPIPWRSSDLPNQFTSSLQSGGQGSALPIAQPGGPERFLSPRFTPAEAPVRGLW